MKYMYIGNRHQRQWWQYFSVWATWQSLMGLIRPAARAGSRSWDEVSPLDVNVPVTYSPWPTTDHWSVLLLSSVSAGCDLVSRVHCPRNWTEPRGTKPANITFFSINCSNIKCRRLSSGTPGKVEETYIFQFCPDKTGRNGTKLEETLKDIRNAGKIIIQACQIFMKFWPKHWNLS